MPSQKLENINPADFDFIVGRLPVLADQPTVLARLEVRAHGSRLELRIFKRGAKTSSARSELKFGKIKGSVLQNHIICHANQYPTLHIEQIGDSLLIG